MVDLSREILTRVGLYWLRLNYLCQFFNICNYVTNVKCRFYYIAIIIIIIIIIVVVVVIIQMFVKNVNRFYANVTYLRQKTFGIEGLDIDVGGYIYI